MRNSKLWAAVILSAAISPAMAGSAIENGGFENATPPSPLPLPSENISSASDSGTIANWWVINNNVLWLANGADGGLTAQSGNYFIDLTGMNHASPQGTIDQTVTLTPGATYQLSFYVGSDFDNSNFGGNKQVGVVINASLVGIFTTDFAATSGNQWQEFTTDFTPKFNTDTVVFEGISAGSGTDYLGLDNVSFQAIPEPGAIGIGLAFVCGAWVKRRGQR